MIGDTVGENYEIIGEIGRGDLGTVYKAKHRQTGELMAVRVLYCHDAEEVALKRFVRSIEATKLLCHPNVLAPVDSGFIDETTPYVVTSYCEGELLSDLIKAEKFIGVARAVGIAAQVCDAIEHAHYYGVIHRNLKPANIMLVQNGPVETAKVLDFGLAKSFFQCSKTGGMKLTMNGEIIGTPEFMSPEQCKLTEIDWRSDIYSMGCLIYTMLTGRAPIKGGSVLDTMVRQETDKPLSFERTCPENPVPRPVQEVIFKALSKKRDERQQTMTELRDELFKAANLSPAELAVDLQPQPKLTRVVRKSKSTKEQTET